MVTVLKYIIITIDHAIYIKVFYDRTVSYITVYTDNVVSTTNNKKEFSEPIRVFGEDIHIKSQEGYVFKYLNFWILQYLVGFNIYQTYLITELVKKWFLAGKIRNVDTFFGYTPHMKMS